MFICSSVVWQPVLVNKTHVYSRTDCSSLSIREIPRILWNSKVHHRVRNSPSVVHVLSQINPIHTFLSCAFRVCVNRFPIYAEVFLVVFSLGFPTKTLCISLLYPILATCTPPPPLKSHLPRFCHFSWELLSYGLLGLLSIELSLQLGTALLWVITHRVVVISYRRIETSYRSHLNSWAKILKRPQEPQKMGTVSCFPKRR